MRCGLSPAARVDKDSESVAIEEVRGLVEAAAIDGRRPLFFAAGSFSEETQALAEEAGAHLFTYDAVEGPPDSANTPARTAVLEGIR